MITIKVTKKIMNKLFVLVQQFFSITDSKSILNNVFNNLNLSEEQKSSVVEYVAQKIIKKLKR